MNIEAWQPDQLVNGHVQGATDAQALQFTTDRSLVAYIKRWWMTGQLWPCGCPGKDFAPGESKVQWADFPNQSFYAYVPTQGVPQAAQAMQNRTIVDQPTPNMADDVFPTGDPLQRQLYEALDGYWEDTGTWDS